MTELNNGYRSTHYPTINCNILRLKFFETNNWNCQTLYSSYTSFCILLEDCIKILAHQLLLSACPPFCTWFAPKLDMKVSSNWGVSSGYWSPDYDNACISKCICFEYIWWLVYISIYYSNLAIWLTLCHIVTSRDIQTYGRTLHFDPFPAQTLLRILENPWTLTEPHHWDFLLSPKHLRR